MIEEVLTDDLASIKAEYQIPLSHQACHTAIVDGYVIEGHVPGAEIRRLLQERPDVVGIAVGGMPAGSPGMDFPGSVMEPFEVVTLNELGETEVFATYP